MNRHGRSSLRRKIFLSHLAVALFCFVILVGAVSASLWLGAQSKQLASAADPSQRLAIQQAHNALEDVTALTFEYVAVSNPDYRQQWRRVWDEQVWPTLTRLEQSLDPNDSYEGKAITALQALMAQLETRQWHILEVRNELGNFPAQAILDTYTVTMERDINRALNVLIDHELGRFQAPTQTETIKGLADLRASFVRASTALHRFVEAGSPAMETALRQQQDVHIAALNALLQRGDLAPTQRESLRWLEREFLLFSEYGDRAIQARKSDQWNIAQHLLINQVIPLSEAAGELIDELLRHNAQQISQSSAQVFSLTQLNIGLSILFLVAMLLAAWFSARFRAERIMAPIQNLVRATRTLAQDQRLVPLPVHGDDELGDLTESFNQMQRSLLQKQAQLHQLATTDPLTKLANRRIFTETMEREWKRCLRDRKAISVIMVDVDRFKQFNDQFGHQAGDHALCAIADVMREQLHRPGDLAARFGGEEFVIILPETDGHGACKITEQLAQEVEKLRISAAAGSDTRYLSVSFGVATCLPDQDLEWEGLIKTADQALYRAKSQGRHCTCESIYGEDGTAETSCDSLRLI